MKCRYCGAELRVQRFTMKLRPRSPRRAVYAYVDANGGTECRNLAEAITLHHPADAEGVTVAFEATP